MKLLQLLNQIKKNSIISINLANKSMNDDVVKHIFDVLKENISVTTVDLSNKNNFYNLNHISSEGASFIADALKINKTIKTINLSGNFIGVKGVKFLDAALKENDTVTFINLDRIGVFTYKDDYIYGNKYMLECDKSLDFEKTQSLFLSISSKLKENKLNSNNITCKNFKEE